MVALPPEHLLVCEAESATHDFGWWRFTLEQIDGTPVLEAGDEETGSHSRLSLLAVVRGLEALEGPSSVTLVSAEPTVIRGLRHGLCRWKETGFRWEHFGVMRPIANADLWKRVERALEIHEVHACWISAHRVSRGAAARPRASRTGPPTDRLRGWLMSRCEPVGLAVA